jgi:hypothetical protein
MIKFKLFSHSLKNKIHTEIVLPFSIQLNHYNKVMGHYEYMIVLSIKFLWFELGCSLRKFEKNKPYYMDVTNLNYNNNYESPEDAQPTSVPEKTIYDV